MIARLISWLMRFLETIEAYFDRDWSDEDNSAGD